MGQYFKAINITNKEYARGSFLKLMETSYFGNFFTTWITGNLKEGGRWYMTRIGWVGDYDGDEYIDNNITSFSEPGVKRTSTSKLSLYSCEEFGYKQIYCPDDDEKDEDEITDEFLKNLFDDIQEYPYIFNHDLREYIDLREHIPKSVSAFIKKDLIVHPLPLLLATSNGKGGGDYYGVNMSMCGHWINKEDKDLKFPLLSREHKNRFVKHFKHLNIKFKE